MAGQSQFALLKQRRFLPYFTVQALGAFNDNVYRQAIIGLLFYLGVSQEEQSLYTTLAPAMRFIVDFSQSEPLMGQNGTGQSGNPASVHYSDGLDAWFKGRFMSLPLQQQNFGRAYGNQRLTLVPGR